MELSDERQMFLEVEAANSFSAEGDRAPRRAAAKAAARAISGGNLALLNNAAAASGGPVHKSRRERAAPHQPQPGAGIGEFDDVNSAVVPSASDLRQYVAGSDVPGTGAS